MGLLAVYSIPDHFIIKDKHIQTHKWSGLFIAQKVAVRTSASIYSTEGSSQDLCFYL